MMSKFMTLLTLTGILLQAQTGTTEESDFSFENAKALERLNAAKNTTATRTSTGYQEGPSGQMKSLQDEVKVLRGIISRIEHRNELEEKINQVTSSIQRGNEAKAHKHWNEILTETHDSPTQLSLHLRKIVIQSYAGRRENVLPLISFISYTGLYAGLRSLIEEMRDYDHVYGGTEIFYIASLIRSVCGTGSSLYAEVPLGAQYVDSYEVQLLNERNQGYLAYKPKQACRGRFCDPNELFTFHNPLHELPAGRSLWTFFETKLQVLSTPTTFTTESPVMNPRYHIRSGVSGNTTQWIHVGLNPSLSNSSKSVFMVTLVNGTEDLVRIRFEQTHLVRNLLMGNHYLGNAFTRIKVMGLEDRFSGANDGNWIVIPVNRIENTNGRARRSDGEDESGLHEPPHQPQYPIICEIDRKTN